MVKRCKGLNSKCFLLTYLAIVGFLLILWVNRIPLIHEDERDIPKQLQNYLLSPPEALVEMDVSLNRERVLTSDVFTDEWSFVYFSHWQCLPECERIYQQLSQLEQALQAADIKFILVNLDVTGGQPAIGNLAKLAKDQGVDADILDADNEANLEMLARNFKALFLKTDYADGQYSIEQQHQIFLVDLKGRVYARFLESDSFDLIRHVFVQIRRFYAESE